MSSAKLNLSSTAIRDLKHAQRLIKGAKDALVLLDQRDVVDQLNLMEGKLDGLSILILVREPAVRLPAPPSAPPSGLGSPRLCGSMAVS